MYLKINVSEDTNVSEEIHRGGLHTAAGWQSATQHTPGVPVHTSMQRYPTGPPVEWVVDVWQYVVRILRCSVHTSPCNSYGFALRVGPQALRSHTPLQYKQGKGGMLQKVG